MNEFQQLRCQKLIEKLMSKPLARMITPDWTDITGKLSLSAVIENIPSYASLFDFYLDMRLLFEPRDPTDPVNSKTNIVLADLSSWLFPKIQNLPRSEDEYKYLKTKRILKKLGIIYGAMLTEFESSPEQSSDPNAQSLASSKMPVQAGQKRIEGLQQRIEHLKTPAQLNAVFAILQKHVPDLTLTPEVVIEGRLITKACANELRDYLNSVNA